MKHENSLKSLQQHGIPMMFYEIAAEEATSARRFLKELKHYQKTIGYCAKNDAARLYDYVDMIDAKRMARRATHKLKMGY